MAHAAGADRAARAAGAVPLELRAVAQQPERASWRLDAILAEARSNERTVIFTSDHGHVLDQDTELSGSAPNARWREPNLELRDGEIEMQGPRVQAACGLDRVILAWNERIRYAAKRNGYHGGCSPAEALVPFAAFRFAGSLPEPWALTPIDAPVWWDGNVPFAVEP